MKLLGDVRAVERAFGNNAKDGQAEKRNFKITVRPASRPDSYYGYGHMQFILHGRELEDCGLDLGTKVEMYLVPEGAEKPDAATVDDIRRQLYESVQALKAAQDALEQERATRTRVERERFAAGEERRALMDKNVALAVELMTLRGATSNFAPAPQMIEAGK